MKKIGFIIIVLILPCIKHNFIFAQQIIKVDIENAIGSNKHLKLSEIVDEIDYIPLETTRDNYIGYIEKIKFVENLIFVQTFNPSSLYSFNYDGQFIAKIGNQGKGPNEYNYLASFAINEKYQEVIIYGLQPSKILIYDYDGILKKELNGFDSKLDHVFDIEFLSQNSFVKMQSNSFGNTPFSYIIYSDEIIIKESVKPVQFSINGSFGSANEFSYYRINNNIFIKENLLNDTIYKITPSYQFKPVYLFEAGKYACPIELRKNFMSFFERGDLKYFLLKRVFDFHNYLIFFFDFDKKWQKGTPQTDEIAIVEESTNKERETSANSTEIERLTPISHEGNAISAERQELPRRIMQVSEQPAIAAGNDASLKNSSNSERIRKVFKRNLDYKTLKTKQSIIKKSESSTDDDAILYYILAFFIPFLAVGLVTDWDTKQVVINILLCFLCGLPGIIHAFIVVSRNV